MPRTSILDETLVDLAGVHVTVGAAAAAAVTIVVALVASWALRRGLTRYAARTGRAHQATFYTLSRVATYVLMALAVVVALGFLDVPLSRLALLSGAVGVGLGFGLQTIFSNFVSGLILLFDKSLKVGDFVELDSGLQGIVRDIKIRATTIVTNDNVDVLVPNSEFVNHQVVNWTHRDVDRRMHIPFGVAYGSDKELVRRAALEAAHEVPFTLAEEGPRRPQVWLVGFGESSLDFELVVWLTPDAVSRPVAVTAAYNWELHSALERHDLEIPFPQRDLHLRGLFGLQDEEALEALRLEPRHRARPASAGGVGTNDAAGEVATAPEEDLDLGPDQD